MGRRFIHTDLELYLTARVREELQARPEPYADGAEVDRVEPEPMEAWPDGPLVVIRDDSGPALELNTAERQVGISVLAGTRENPKAAMDLARLVMAIATDLADNEPGNPIAAVTDWNGPYLVPEDAPRARAYGMVTYSVVGVAL